LKQLEATPDDQKAYHPEGSFTLAGLDEIKDGNGVLSPPYNKLCENLYANLASLKRDIAGELGCKESNICVSVPKEPEPYELK
jgi:hypothetical protein